MMSQPPPSNPKAVLMATAIRFLALRSRFKAEVIARLAKKAKELGLADPLTLINQIIASLERAGFIDDAKNLAGYIRYRLETKMKGPYWIKSSLLRLGLAKTDIERSLAENAGRESQKAVIGRFIDKKLRGKSPDLKTKAKLFRALVSRGFSSSLVAEAFDESQLPEV